MEPEYNQTPEIIFWLIMGISVVMIVVMVFILPWKMRKEQRDLERSKQEAAEKAKAGANQGNSPVVENAGGGKPGTEDP